jgi:hypothetical protein
VKIGSPDSNVRSASATAESPAFAQEDEAAFGVHHVDRHAERVAQDRLDVERCVDQLGGLREALRLAQPARIDPAL